ncbi:MAG: RNA 2',3'-cyclic phosphodiesterase [Bacteroidales bacterium]|nr:RNA 2',3'-cyclic phosphodiesterase [Bacteroidales bacterium]
MKRTFIAIPIQAGPKLRATHTNLRNELKNEKIKWVEPDHFHLTLFFLGDTREDQVEQVDRMLASLVGGYSEFDIRLEGLGVFKNIRKPRVLWAGIKDYEPMRKIKSAVDREMSSLGFEPDKREFKPHLTLARIKWIDNKEKLQHLIDAHQQEKWQSAHIDQLIYFESRLTQSGPVYTPIGRYKLNSSGK